MNNQQVSKIIEFFRINRNYHSPYTFILDGNFLVHLIQKSLSLEAKLKPLIPGKLRFKVTDCTLQELSMLGEEFRLVWESARQMEPLKCSHTSQSVDRCILDHAEKSESTIICTQDKVLKRKLRGRNIAIMYFGPDQRITMEDIERHVLSNIKDQEREKLMPSEFEQKELEEFQKEQRVFEKVKEKQEQRKLASQKGVELKYIKKNVARGPNPLSIKKKKTKEDFRKEEEPPVEKRKKIRKRKNRKGEREE